MKPILPLILCLVLLSGCETHDPGIEAVAKGYNIGDDDTPLDGTIHWSPSGKTVYLTNTIVVESGEVFDGRMENGQLKRFLTGKEGLGDGSQKEAQKPLFLLHAGATLRNVIIDRPAADGVHLYLDRGSSDEPTVLEGVEWRDVGEDAITVKTGKGEVILERCKFAFASDKSIQLSSIAEVRVRAIDCQWYKCQKAIRSGNEGSPLQWMEIDGGSARDVDYVWFGNHPQARGQITGGFQIYGSTEMALEKNGARVVIQSAGNPISESEPIGN